jgi:hypothetical protein
VHEQVEPPEASYGVGELFLVTPLTDVAGDRGDAGEVGGRGGECVGVTGVGDDPPGGLCEGAGEGQAETGGAAGHDRDGCGCVEGHVPMLQVQVTLRSRGWRDRCHGDA